MRNQRTRSETSVFQFRSVSYAGDVASGEQQFGGPYIFLKPELPGDLLEVQNLWTWIVLQFRTALPTGNKVLKKVAIVDDWDAPTYVRELTVNKAAVGDVLDYQIDLTSLINPFGENWIRLEVEPIVGGLKNGDILLWKADLVYESQETRL